MHIKLNSVVGIDDAIKTMFISKHSLTEELEQEITDVVWQMRGPNANIIGPDQEVIDKYNKWMDMLCKFGKKHITLLKFVDISVSVYGLHRAGQDDWDAHAKRFDNRIIRNSSRFAGIKDKSHLQNMSDYYSDKVLTTDAVLEILGINMPEEITHDDKKYVRCFNGYVVEEYRENQDVLRGLYNLGFPSNFIFKCNLTEFAHVYKERGIHGGANPEVKQCAEMIMDALEEFEYRFNRNLMMSIEN